MNLENLEFCSNFGVNGIKKNNRLDALYLKNNYDTVQPYFFFFL